MIPLLESHNITGPVVARIAADGMCDRNTYRLGLVREKQKTAHRKEGISRGVSRFPVITVFHGLLWMFLACPLHAVGAADDTVILCNDDIIKGKIVKMEDGVLLIETSYAGPIKIQWMSIRDIKTTHPVSVLLVSGETLAGILETDPQGNPLLVSTEYGDGVVLQRDEIRAINIPPVKWSGSISLGASSQTGNTETKSSSVSMEASRRTMKDRYSVKLFFNYAEESEEVSARNTFGAMKYDYFHTDHVYSFVALELMNDTFKDITLRTVAGPGLGYQVWDDARKALLVELGAAYTNEDRETAEDDDWAAGRGNLFVRFNLFDIVTLSETVLAYINLEENEDYQVRSEANISSALGSSWSLKLSNIVEYDNAPSEGIEKSDVQWIVGLQYAF